MSADKAARLIWKQIRQGRSKRVMDGRARMMQLVAAFLPTSLLKKIIWRSLLGRCKRD